MSTTELTELAWDLASDGFAGRESAVRQVVRAARAAGVTAVVVDTLADPAQPEAARLRAFGRVAPALAANAAAAPLTSRAA
jgi:hypothetical protein